MTPDTQAPAFEGWCILELMGHRRLAGYLREQAIGGASFIRIDVPNAAWQPGVAESKEWTATQMYSPSAVYCITPTTEALARQVATTTQPAPVERWELPPASPAVRDIENHHPDKDDEPDETDPDNGDDDDSVRDDLDGGLL